MALLVVAVVVAWWVAEPLLWTSYAASVVLAVLVSSRVDFHNLHGPTRRSEDSACSQRTPAPVRPMSGTRQGDVPYTCSVSRSWFSLCTRGCRGQAPHKRNSASTCSHSTRDLQLHRPSTAYAPYHRQSNASHLSSPSWFLAQVLQCAAIHSEQA